MGVLFQIHFWDQSHITIVWNTRETGDIHYTYNSLSFMKWSPVLQLSIGSAFCQIYSNYWTHLITSKSFKLYVEDWQLTKHDIELLLNSLPPCSELHNSSARLKVVLSGTESPKLLRVKRDYKPVSLLSTCCQTPYKSSPSIVVACS